MAQKIQKRRPAIIVNDNSLGKLPLKIIIPITDWKDHYSIAPWMVKIEPDITNGLSKTSAADCFQVRSLSQERLIKKLGSIDNLTLAEIKEALKKYFRYNNSPLPTRYPHLCIPAQNNKKFCTFYIWAITGN